MVSKTEVESRVSFHRAALEKLRAAYIALLEHGVQSYSIGSRSLTRLDLTKIADEIKYHEKEIDGLEELLRGGRRRKAVGVVPRDI